MMMRMKKAAMGKKMKRMHLKGTWMNKMRKRR